MGRLLELRGILPSDPAAFRTDFQYIVDETESTGIPFVFHAVLPQGKKRIA